MRVGRASGIEYTLCHVQHFGYVNTLEIEGVEKKDQSLTLVGAARSFGAVGTKHVRAVGSTNQDSRCECHA